MVPLRLYLYAGLLAALLAAGLWYRHSLIAEGEARVVQADRDAADKQREAVAAEAKKWSKTLEIARESHDAETAALLVPTPTHHVLCHNAPGPSPVPGPAGVPSGASPAAGVVQQDAGLHSDIGPALDMLAKRADKLAADARELDSLTH